MPPPWWAGWRYVFVLVPIGTRLSQRSWTRSGPAVLCDVSCEATELMVLASVP